METFWLIIQGIFYLCLAWLGLKLLFWIYLCVFVLWPMSGVVDASIERLNETDRQIERDRKERKRYREWELEQERKSKQEEKERMDRMLAELEKSKKK